MTGRLLLRLARRDSGRAIVEFLVVGLLLLVPVVYFIVTLSRVQAAAIAVSTASREAGRAFTTAATEDSAYARAQAAARLSFEDYDFGADGAVRVRCDGSPCLRPEGRVEAVATVNVRLPLVPDILSGALPTMLPVSATHVATVDRFRGR
ncbi:MAG: pilus assembly protein [Lapillicoccus sp.]